MYRKNTASQFVAFAGVNATTGAVLTGAGSLAGRRCLDGTFAALGGTITEDTGLGFYKIALTQADTNGNDCQYFITATNIVPVCINIVTTACDPTAATNFGITSLPTTAVTTNASLLTSGTGTDQLQVAAGLASTNVKQINAVATTPVTTVKAIQGLTTADVVASVTGAVGSVTGAVGSVTGAVGSVTARVTANTDQINGTAQTAADVGRMAQIYVIDSGTAQSGSGTTIQLRAGAPDLGNPNGLYNMFVVITSGSGSPAVRSITVWNNGTKTATLSKTLPVAADNTSVYAVVVGANLDAQGFPAHFSSLGIDVSGNINEVLTVAEVVLCDETTVTDSLSAAALATVKTQAVAALNTDTYAEPGQGTPPATTTLVQKIGYSYKAWRNRTTQTASQYSLFNDDAATIDQKGSFSDNGTTADRGEIATGP